MLLTAGLKYPVFPIESETVSKTLLGSTFAFLWRINHEVAGFITRNSFELFLYTHALAAYAIAIGAFFSRFEVFYPAIIFWGLFVLDKIVTKTFYIHDFECKREHKGRNYDDALRLVLTKSGDKNMLLKTWKPQAGQIIFLQCQELGFTIGRQWHAFSLSSISEDGDTVELLIKVHKDGWTDKLKRRLYQSYEERSKDRTSHNSNIVSRLGNEIAFWSSCMFRRGAGERLDTLNFKVMGPFGSSFSDLGDYEFILLIGGGAGIASSLSILKDIKRKMALSPRRVRVWFIWTTRSLDSVLWCWESLKETLADAQGAYSIRVSIHVTQSGGLTRSEQRVVEFADYESPSVLEKDVFLTRTSSTVLGESFDHVSSQVNSSELNSLIAPKQTAQGTDYSTALQITNLSALLSAGGISDEVKRRSNLRSIEVTSADLLPLPARKSVRLKDCLRQGRPDWAKYLVSFSAQAFAGNHIGKTKICACGPKALYASINQAVNMISNRYKMDLEFNSENFE